MPTQPTLSKLQKDKKREYRIKHRDKILAKQREWYAANKEEQRKKHKEWYEKNRDKVCEKQKEDRLKNPEKYKERSKKLYRKHREKRLEYHKKYNAKNKDKIAKRRKEYYYKNKSKYNERSSTYRKNNPDKVWKTYLQWTYNMTTKDYKILILSQRSKCVCGQSFTELPRKKIHIDHDHATGKVRGILCDSCNHTIGMAKENPKRLRRLADYLEGCLPPDGWRG